MFKECLQAAAGKRCVCCSSAQESTHLKNPTDHKVDEESRTKKALNRSLCSHDEHNPIYESEPIKLKQKNKTRRFKQSRSENSKRNFVANVLTINWKSRLCEPQVLGALFGDLFFGLFGRKASPDLESTACLHAHLLFEKNCGFFFQHSSLHSRFLLSMICRSIVRFILIFLYAPF